jgi:hypothetical protein
MTQAVGDLCGTFGVTGDAQRVVYNRSVGNGTTENQEQCERSGMPSPITQGVTDGPNVPVAALLFLCVNASNVAANRGWKQHEGFV